MEVLAAAGVRTSLAAIWPMVTIGLLLVHGWMGGRRPGFTACACWP